MPIERKLPERFSPDELQALVRAAIELDRRGAVEVVRRKRGSETVERFQQHAIRTPLLPWVAVLMLTGCRVHEAEGLRWSDVNLDNGAVIFRSRKTGMERIMLLDDPLNRVSPALLAMLRRWRIDRPKALIVLPEDGDCGEAVFPKHPWSALCHAAGVKVRPKALRSNWVSYMAALGRRASDVALMAGHGVAVMERHYLSYAHARLAGGTLDDAMGVGALLADFQATVPAGAASSTLRLVGGLG